jgi:hypothetical protein
MHCDSRYQSLLPLAISAILSLSLVFCNPATAQNVTGSIYGTVTDTSGAVIPNASVTVTNVDTNETHTALSTGAGTYVFPVLSPGNYKASSVSAGFTTVVQNNIRLAANQNVNVSFAIKAGAATTTVTVLAGTTLVDTRESTIGTTIDQAKVQELPLVDRNAYDLVILVPGVTNYHASAPIGDPNNTQFSTNGLPGNYNSYYLDGAYNSAIFRGGGNVTPNPDALAEFSILTSNQDAEFGRYPGAVVNTITRSGSNQFHGIVYDFLRNTILTAKNYFANSVTPLVYNVYGGGFGGPAIRNKLFFYLNYEGTSINTSQIIPLTSIVVPSALERAGNFSQSAKKPTQTGCAAGINPVAPATICIDPVATAALQYVPLAIDSANHPAQQTGSANVRANQGTARLDYQFNAAHKLQFTSFQSRGTQLYPNGNQQNQIYDYDGALYADSQSNYIGGDTWVVSPRAVNSFRAVYSLHQTIGTPDIPGGRLADLGSTIPEAGTGGLTTQPIFQITGYWQMGSGNPSNSNINQLSYGILDTYNYSKGPHNAKVGGTVIENRFQETAVNDGSGTTTFTGGSTGNALADFMEGHGNSFTQNNGTYTRVHALDPSLFAQDDWHITQRLTLDLGARWEVFFPYAGAANFGTFVPGVRSTIFPTAPVGLLTAGDPNIPNGIEHASYKRFAPRVGFADDLLGNGKLSLKGAYGIFYTTTPILFDGLLQQEPFDLTLTFNGTTSLVNPYTGIAPYNGVSPFATKFNPASPIFVAGATLYSLNPYTSATPYVQEYNLALEQQLAANWVMQIAYVGNTSRKFYVPRDENAAIYSAGATTANANIQSRRPYQPEATIELFDTANNMNYNSLQVSLTRQFARRFSLNASYVWSKTFDTEDVSPTAGGALELADESDPRMDYGLSTDNVGQVFVASYSYALPDVKRYGIFGKEVLSGWKINGITSLYTGAPFNLLSKVDTNFDGVATDRPNTVGNPLLGKQTRAQKIAEFFNTSAFAVPHTGQLYGNTPRNSLIGPGYVDTDLSGSKDFPFYRESHLQFRGEVFNTFNNVNLGAPGSTLGTATFGEISSASAPRIVQFALKFEF